MRVIPAPQAAALALLLSLTGGFATAENTITAGIGAVLEQDNSSMAAVSDARFAALDARPSPTFDEAALAALPEATGGEDWFCLSEALYFEARGESLEGLYAVGEVILNRTASGDFPRTVCGVVHQGSGRAYQCQFSYTCDGRSETIAEPEAWDRVAKVARSLLDGAPRLLTDGATHFHTRSVTPSWARRFDQTAAIGAHLFYRAPLRTASN